jgi:hypothetical protein
MVSVGWRFGVRHLLSTRSVRATPVECVCALPGDELITNPIGTLTHAVTIQRARPDVWQWLVQMGAGSRAGWYSYDSLDNRRQPSATRIVPELQRIDVGTLFPALPGTVDGFQVLQFEPSGASCLDGGLSTTRRLSCRGRSCCETKTTNVPVSSSGSEEDQAVRSTGYRCGSECRSCVLYIS